MYNSLVKRTISEPVKYRNENNYRQVSINKTYFCPAYSVVNQIETSLNREQVFYKSHVDNAEILQQRHIHKKQENGYREHRKFQDLVGKSQHKKPEQSCHHGDSHRPDGVVQNGKVEAADRNSQPQRTNRPDYLKRCRFR